MKTKKKKRAALKIAITLAISAGTGGTKNSVSMILTESYHAALALLNEIDRDKDDETPAQHDRADQGKAQ